MRSGKDKSWLRVNNKGEQNFLPDDMSKDNNFLNHVSYLLTKLVKAFSTIILSMNSFFF